MQRRRGPAGSEIAGLGHYQPERILTNDELATMMQTNDDWIRRRTGIVTRHIAGATDTVASMATAAAAMALQDARVDSSEIDLVIVATTSNDERTPSAAGRVSASLGLRAPAVLDINTACSGFEYALGLADQAIAAGSATNALVIGSEKLSDFTDWTDRSTAVLTADGAGAVVVRGGDEVRIGPVAWSSAPDLVEAVLIAPPTNMFTQQGQNIYRWALQEAAGHARKAIEASGIDIADIRVLACHQANLRIIEPLAELLGLDDRIVVTDITESGNTSAASVPLGLSKWWHAGRIPRDAPALLFGFGGGFTFAGQVVITPR